MATKTTGVESTTENKAPKKVKILLPLTRNEKDDVYVCVNGKSLLIKRGVEVEVDPCFVEVIRNREKMLAEALAYEEQAKSNANQGAK